MTRKNIDVAEYAGHIVSALPHGALLTTKAGGHVNTMTIGWGTLGVNWGKRVFAVYIREGRYTRELLDAGGDFTVSFPLGEYDKRIAGICGTRSGRNTDKITMAGLTLVDPEIISSPAIKQFPLTLECRVMYRQIQELPLLRDEALRDALYPQDIPGDNPMANRDAHVSYYGEILSSYIIEE